MKVCPVCKSNVFDDMQVCYNCLHDFKNNIQAARLPGPVAQKPQAGVDDFVKSCYSFFDDYFKSVK